MKDLQITTQPTWLRKEMKAPHAMSIDNLLNPDMHVGQHPIFLHKCIESCLNMAHLVGLLWGHLLRKAMKDGEEAARCTAARLLAEMRTAMQGKFSTEEEAYFWEEMHFVAQHTRVQLWDTQPPPEHIRIKKEKCSEAVGQILTEEASSMLQSVQ
jgi:hypothetical protein